MSYTMNDNIDKVEDLENWRKRLTYRSWHRGMKEMDLLMGTFADQHVPTFNAEQLRAYDAVLDIEDPDLYAMYMGQIPPSEAQNSDILTMFLGFKL